MRKLAIPGVLKVAPKLRPDERGSFAKLFHRGTFQVLGLPTDFAEVFVTESRAQVVRGLHFQRPPKALDKLVVCLRGQVLDVLLDLRVGSPTYGRHVTVALSGESMDVLCVPAGVAHGFAALSEHAVMMYMTTEAYDPLLDDGIRWDSADVEWPCASPLVSERDMSFPPLSALDSPFVFEPDRHA